MKGSRPIRFRIITPEKTLFNEMVNHVVLPGTEGGVGIFHHHAPFMSYLKPGQMQIYHDEIRINTIGIRSGLVEFKDDLLTVLTTEEIPPEQISAGTSECEEGKSKH